MGKKNRQKSNISFAEPKIEKKQKVSEKSSASFFTFDIQTNERTSKQVELDSRFLNFDMNSPDLFNPDEDCREVAKKCWNWILNPISLEKFQKEIMGQKVMVISRQDTEFEYLQVDEADDILTLEMVRNYVKEVET